VIGKTFEIAITKMTIEEKRNKLNDLNFFKKRKREAIKHSLSLSFFESIALARTSLEMLWVSEKD
jgi:hypothetical protein